MKKIRDYVEKLFEECPDSKRKTEIKEELIADLEEKYSDLIKSGKTDKDAYKDVIAGIGDIHEILKDIDQPVDSKITEEYLKRKKATGLVVSISVFLYFLSVIWVIVFEEMFQNEIISVSGFLFIAAIATCILIYHFVATPKIDEPIVVKQKKKDDGLRSIVSSILWLFIIVIYFIISFVFQSWAISWILFLVGALLECVVSLIFKIRGIDE